MARRRFSEREVRDAVAASPSLSAVLRKLGLRPAGGNHRTIRRLIQEYQISTDHMDPNWANRCARPRTATPLERILVEGSTYNRGKLKQRLYNEGLKQRRCELCEQGEEWRGQPMSLILDHVNGCPTDNRLENLRIVCPNCAATLETHCGRKNRLDVSPRFCLVCGAEFTPKYASHRYCSQACGSRSRGPRDPRPEARKVTRPSYEQLAADLDQMSVLAVGRKYGVSDNAVRKWMRSYEYEHREER
jgi:hypothetical protein